MDGDIGAWPRNTTVLDEVQGGGAGKRGGGVAERDGVMGDIDIIEGTAGQGVRRNGRLYHRHGGLIDAIRSFAHRLHFHHFAAAGPRPPGALASVRWR